MTPRQRPRRPDTYELAAERMRAVGPYEPLPGELRRFSPKRLVLYVFLGALAVAVVRAGLGSPTPSVGGSCTKPAFAFDRSAVPADGVVRWSASGPSGAQVSITADSTVADQGRLLDPVTLKSCAATGSFRAVLKDGAHVLRVFLARPDGTTTVLGTHTLEVGASR